MRQSVMGPTKRLKILKRVLTALFYRNNMMKVQPALFLAAIIG
jgi:hypothetical protein